MLPMCCWPLWFLLTCLEQRISQTHLDCYYCSRGLQHLLGLQLLVRLFESQWKHLFLCLYMSFYVFNYIPGYMFDAFGSYNEGLILMGVFVALSGLMLYPIPCIRTALEKVIWFILKVPKKIKHLFYSLETEENVPMLWGWEKVWWTK